MKETSPYHGFYYIHFCDIDRRDSEDREKLLNKKVQKYAKDLGFTELVKQTQYFSQEKPMDSTTSQIIDILRTSENKDEPTPIVFMDESLANSYDWIGRLKHGCVVLYDGKFIDKESLINTTAKYIDLQSYGQYAENKASRGHETIQIVRPDLFKFDVASALQDFRKHYRYAPCKWLPIMFQYTLGGSVVSLANVFEEPENVDIDHRNKVKTPFHCGRAVHVLEQFDTSLDRAGAERIIKRNKKGTINLQKQFSL